MTNGLIIDCMPYFVYRFVNAESETIYIGYTKNVHGRFADHKAGKSWWPNVKSYSIELFGTESEARRAERAAIERVKPIHNRQFLEPRFTLVSRVEDLPGGYVSPNLADAALANDCTVEQFLAFFGGIEETHTESIARLDRTVGRLTLGEYMRAQELEPAA